MRNDLGVDLDERDYAKVPFSASELKELFAGRDPRDYSEPEKPRLQSDGPGAANRLRPTEALELMAKEPNLIKRPIAIAGKDIIAGFDREQPPRSAEVEIRESAQPSALHLVAALDVQ